MAVSRVRRTGFAPPSTTPSHRSNPKPVFAVAVTSTAAPGAYQPQSTPSGAAVTRPGTPAVAGPRTAVLNRYCFSYRTVSAVSPNPIVNTRSRGAPSLQPAAPTRVPGPVSRPGSAASVRRSNGAHGSSIGAVTDRRPSMVMRALSTPSTPMATVPNRVLSSKRLSPDANSISRSVSPDAQPWCVSDPGVRPAWTSRFPRLPGNGSPASPRLLPA